MRSGTGTMMQVPCTETTPKVGVTHSMARVASRPVRRRGVSARHHEGDAGGSSDAAAIVERLWQLFL